MQRALLILLVGASYLLLAGARPASLAVLLVIAAALAATSPRQITSDISQSRRLDLALIAIAGILLVQMVPLPATLVALVSPARSALVTALRVAPPGAGAPSWTTVSIDPSATLIALGTFLLGVLSFWGARAAFAAGGHTRAFCRVLTVMAALFATLAVIQRAIAPGTVLFAIEPETRSANPFGAFVNRNHFAAWLLLACGPITGYFIARLRTHPVRSHFRASLSQVMRSSIVFTALAALIVVGTLVLSLSRSAVTGLGAAAVAGWWLGRPRLSVERTNLPMVLAVIGAVLLIFVVFVDTDRWAQRLQQSFATDVQFSRLSIWRESLPIVGDFPVAGTGAGTYSEAMSFYQESRVWVGSMRRWAHFNNAHSHYLQVLTEGGLLLVLPVIWALWALAVLGMQAARADKGEMFWVRVGAGASLAGLAVQSLWDVALTMPANAALAGVLAALLLYHRNPRGPAVAEPAADLAEPRALTHRM